MRWLVIAAGVGSALSVGVAQAEALGSDIVLKGFSDANYEPLNEAVGDRVCVVGSLQINTAGIYFQLQPIEADGLIDVGFSRILTGLSHEYAKRHKMRSGKVYRVCGLLQDATPFKRCDFNDCKWFKLEPAELRRKG